MAYHGLFVDWYMACFSSDTLLSFTGTSDLRSCNGPDKSPYPVRSFAKPCKLGDLHRLFEIYVLASPIHLEVDHIDQHLP